MYFLVTTLASAALASAPLPGLDFRCGDLRGWVGEGFYLTVGGPRGVSASLGVCSSDAGNPPRTGMLRHAFRVPEGAGRIRFRAYAAHGPSHAPRRLLDVVLLGKGNRAVPRLVRTAAGWSPSPTLLGKQAGRAREYAWDISALVGQTLQIAIVDLDDRPGCHVWCGGFRLDPADDSEAAEFARHMLALEREHDLTPLGAFRSEHFLAWSNADAGFTAERLRDAERLRGEFLEHFRAAGFPVRPPPRRLMVAVFDGQGGFEAYLGRKMPATLVGIYDRATNRFVVYDLHQNRGLTEGRKRLLRAARDIPIDLDRAQYTGGVERRVRELGDDLNVSTTMHEVAHQLSFNCGLLARDGDVPLWLAEGLACYFEATERGAWQGPGAVSLRRVSQLTLQLEKVGKLLPLSALVGGDHWVQDASAIGLGYAQSWALFRMLLEEQPAALRRYLELVRPRRAPEHRLTDFRQAFGADLTALDRRHLEYVRGLVRTHGARAAK